MGWLNGIIIKIINHTHELIFDYIEALCKTTRIDSHCEMKSTYSYEKSHID